MALPKYRPVVEAKSGSYFGAALVGTNSVILGWSIAQSKLPSKLMGFAVRRTKFSSSGAMESMKWLNGMKRFKASGNDILTEVSLEQAPLQRFRWNDYTVDSSCSYEYDVFPMVGKPGALERKPPLVFKVRPSQNEVDGIGIYTNRGVTAAKAYLQRFGGQNPNDIEDGSAFRWLERGLRQSLMDFIAKAKKGERLHICIYEFHDPGIADALRVAKSKGVKVEIVYHFKITGKAKKKDSATKKSDLVIKAAKLTTVATARTNTGHLSHNKFIVHLTPTGRPTRVWTASANFSENAFHYQTNVALTFEENEVAKQYETYFQMLKANPKRQRKKTGHVFFRDSVDALNKAIEADPPPGVNKILYSPVRSLHVVDLAAELIASAESAIFLSAPFGLHKDLVKAIGENDNDVLEFGLANSTVRKKIEKLRRRNTRMFTPNRLETFRGEKWDAKAFGAHKIHAKSIVIDPWGDSPSVLIGSANFSEGSCKSNDENSILIQGDKRFSSIIATEFLRMFDHYKSRYWIKESQKNKRKVPFFLNDNPDWSDIYYKKDGRSRKLRDREVFSGK